MIKYSLHHIKKINRVKGSVTTYKHLKKVFYSRNRGLVPKRKGSVYPWVPPTIVKAAPAPICPRLCPSKPDLSRDWWSAIVGLYKRPSASTKLVFSECQEALPPKSRMLHMPNTYTYHARAPKSYPRYLAALAISVVLLLSGCTSGGVQDDAGRPVTDVYSVFQHGDVRLRCGPSCAFAWGSNRAQLSALYQAQLWKDLALKVSDVNFEADLSYFYLGKAAEGLGFNSAANIYYRLSNATRYKCPESQCSGIVLPKEANAGLARITPQLSAPPAFEPVAATASAPVKVVASASGNPKVEVSVDEFTKAKTYLTDSQYYATPNDAQKPNRELVGVRAALAVVDKEGTTTYNIIYVTTETQYSPFEGARLYSRATDASGATLPVQSLDRNVKCQNSGCDYTEKGVVMINQEYLKTHATTGIRIRLEGSRGTQVLEVDGSKVTALLDAMSAR